MMLQLRLGGAAPEVGERHFACPSDCFPWASNDWMCVIGDEVPGEDREAMCSTLVGECRDLETVFVRGELTCWFIRRRAVVSASCLRCGRRIRCVQVASGRLWAAASSKKSGAGCYS